MSYIDEDDLRCNCSEFHHTADKCPNPCFKCQEYGHLGPNCTKEICVFCRGEHKGEECPTGCWKCGNRDHPASSCTYRCRKCNKEAMQCACGGRDDRLRCTICCFMEGPPRVQVLIKVMSCGAVAATCKGRSRSVFFTGVLILACCACK